MISFWEMLMVLGYRVTQTLAAETRNQRKVRNNYPVSTKVFDTVDDGTSPDDFRKAQGCDDTLTKTRVSVNYGKTLHIKFESHMDSSKCFPQLATVSLLLFVYIYLTSSRVYQLVCNVKSKSQRTCQCIMFFLQSAYRYKYAWSNGKLRKSLQAISGPL